MPDESVNLCITSPPYYGLRDYGVKGQIGLEPDFTDYVRKLVRIFVELRRVLKNDGSFYLNLGDTYSHSGGAGGQYEKWHSKNRLDGFKKYEGHKVKSLPPKCMIGIPWRVALALIDEKWILRNDVIWHKPNALPSSVKDRLTNTYEHIFHFVKSRKYYYNLDAIRVPHKSVTIERVKRYVQKGEHYDPKKHKTDPRGMHQPPTKVLENSAKKGLNPLGKNPGDVWKVYSLDNPVQCVSKPKIVRGRHFHPKGKNPGDLWDINTRGFKGAHFAVYPEELLHRPILSSSRVRDIVLDPFIGSGTTAVVTKKFGRRFLGCDINSEYVKIARHRLVMISGTSLFYNSDWQFTAKY